MGPDQGVPSPLGERLCRRGEPARSRAFPVRGLGGGADGEDGWLPHGRGARRGMEERGFDPDGVSSLVSTLEEEGFFSSAPVDAQKAVAEAIKPATGPATAI